jgi:hypothetical protein
MERYKMKMIFCVPELSRAGEGEKEKEIKERRENHL